MESLAAVGLAIQRSSVQTLGWKVPWSRKRFGCSPHSSLRTPRFEQKLAIETTKDPGVVNVDGLIFEVLDVILIF